MIAPSPELVDTHCHLTMSAFDDDRDLVIERAKRLGLKKSLYQVLIFLRAKKPFP